MRYEVVVLIKGWENKNWFIGKGLAAGFMVRMGNGGSVTIGLELAYSKGKQEIYRIPTVLKDIVEPRINVWESGCGGEATVVADIYGEKLNAVSLRVRSGMAMFSIPEDMEFISVTVFKKRITIEKHSFLRRVDPEDSEKSILTYVKKNIFSGKWTPKIRKLYPKYENAVEAAIKRSEWKGDSLSNNPFYAKKI